MVIPKGWKDLKRFQKLSNKYFKSKGYKDDLPKWEIREDGYCLRNETLRCDLVFNDNEIFNHSLYFDKCTFNKTFSEYNDHKHRLHFLNCTFTDFFVFKHSHFGKGVYFKRCTFISEQVLIYLCDFDDQLVLCEIEVNGDILFFYTQINDFQLVKIEKYKETEKKDKGTFTIFGLDSRESARVLFLDCKFETTFENIFLLDSNMENAEFIGVEWHKRKKRRFRIGDEDKKIDTPEFFYSDSHLIRFELKFEKEINKGHIEEVENLYTQLASSYARSSMLPMSGKFYISKMEMRRKRKKNFFTRNLFSLEALYKWFSNYGESILRPLLISLLIFVVCSIILSISGKGYTSLLEYFCRNFSLLTGTLKVEASAANIILVTIGFERISIISFIGLSLLAIKRRFRRE
jgi:hypothetical protein